MRASGLGWPGARFAFGGGWWRDEKRAPVGVRFRVVANQWQRLATTSWVSDLARRIRDPRYAEFET